MTIALAGHCTSAFIATTKTRTFYFFSQQMRTSRKDIDNCLACDLFIVLY